MDISTVASKVAKNLYFMQKEFNEDVQQIWKNAILFNQEGEDIYKMAVRLSLEFENMIKMSNEELFTRKKVVPQKTAQPPKIAKTAVKSGKPLKYEE